MSSHGKNVTPEGGDPSQKYHTTVTYGENGSETSVPTESAIYDRFVKGTGTGSVCTIVSDQCGSGLLAKNANDPAAYGGRGGPNGSATAEDQEIVGERAVNGAGPTGATMIESLLNPKFYNELAASSKDVGSNGETIPYPTGNDISSYFGSSGYAPEATNIVDGQVHAIAKNPQRAVARAAETGPQVPVVCGNQEIAIFGPIDPAQLSGNPSEIREQVHLPAQTGVSTQQQQQENLQRLQEQITLETRQEPMTPPEPTTVPEQMPREPIPEGIPPME